MSLEKPLTRTNFMKTKSLFLSKLIVELSIILINT